MTQIKIKSANDNHIERTVQVSDKQKYMIEFRECTRRMLDDLLAGPDSDYATSLLIILEEELDRAHKIWKIRNEFDDGPDAA